MPELCPPTVWVWTNIDQIPAAQLHSYTQDLSLSESIRLGNISSEPRRREYIAGHQLLRTALSSLDGQWQKTHYLEHPLEQPPSIVGPNSKALNFNLSHSGNTLCCAVSPSHQLGIDIESPPKRYRSLQGIADNYFSAKQAKDLSLLPVPQQEKAFYRLWTLKESLIKANKSSIAEMGMAMEFTPLTSPHQSTWHSYFFTLNDCYCALTASAPLGRQLKVREISTTHNTTADKLITLGTPLITSL